MSLKEHIPADPEPGWRAWRIYAKDGSRHLSTLFRWSLDSFEI